MDVSVITNKTVIYPIVEALFDDVTEQDTPKTVLDTYIDVDAHWWLRIDKDGELLGVLKFKPYNRTMLDVHPFMVKKHRRHSEKAMSAALDYCDKYAPDMYTSTITNVPACKRYATLFAHKMGFKEIGRYKDGFKKNNVYHDMVLFQRGRRYD